MSAVENIEPRELAKSVSSDQHELLRWIVSLHCPAGIDCDATYGHGVFYKGMTPPTLRFDIDPQAPGVVEASSESLPVNDAAIGSMMFDPPFLTYVRNGRRGNGGMALSRRFSGYWRYEELADHYCKSLSEAFRVLIPGGVLIFKCQDIVHNHRLHCTHANVIAWASERGFRLKDLFVLAARHRMPSPNRVGAQKHARIYHSYFLVLEKWQ